MQQTSQIKSPSLCHYCQNKTISQSNKFFSQCCKKRCYKSYCIDCIRKQFDSQFKPQMYKKQTWICYSCQQRCSCKKCNKSFVNFSVAVANNTFLQKESENSPNRSINNYNPSSTYNQQKRSNQKDMIDQRFILKNDMSMSDCQQKRQTLMKQKQKKTQKAQKIQKVQKIQKKQQQKVLNTQTTTIKKTVQFNLSNLQPKQKQQTSKSPLILSIDQQLSEQFLPTKSYRPSYNSNNNQIKQKKETNINPSSLVKPSNIINPFNSTTQYNNNSQSQQSPAIYQPLSNNNQIKGMQSPLLHYGSQLSINTNQLPSIIPKSKTIIKSKRQRAMLGKNIDNSKYPSYLQNIMKRKQIFRNYIIEHSKKSYQQLINEERQRCKQIALKLQLNNASIQLQQNNNNNLINKAYSSFNNNGLSSSLIPSNNSPTNSSQLISCNIPQTPSFQPLKQPTTIFNFIQPQLKISTLLNKQLKQFQMEQESLDLQLL